MRAASSSLRSLDEIDDLLHRAGVGRRDEETRAADRSPREGRRRPPPTLVSTEGSPVPDGTVPSSDRRTRSPRRPPPLRRTPSISYVVSAWNLLSVVHSCDADRRPAPGPPLSQQTRHPEILARRAAPARTVTDNFSSLRNLSFTKIRNIWKSGRRWLEWRPDARLLRNPGRDTRAAGGRGRARSTRPALLTAEPCCLQLRAKSATARALEAAGRRLLSLCRAAGVPFSVNDRLDVALAIGADVVHLGQDDLPLADARRVRAGAGRPDLLIGFSTHNRAQALAAAPAAPTTSASARCSARAAS